MKLEEVYEFMNNIEVVSMATVVGDQPRVRIMALISHNDNYWCCTIASRPKMEQFRANDKFEFCSIIKKNENLGSIRALGKAQIIQDFDVKKELSKAIPFFSGYWEDYTDPKFGLIRLDINKIEVQSPYDKKFYTFDI
ncbi:MAG: pyridoxamine 5'-phosphate oxidase family protein [Candidatus Lokiarchaeota archaeon]|nr:pyridoxamine 5'-phosphate oxidase family protein [Candidatus Lokiarchaeota archaeon]